MMIKCKICECEFPIAIAGANHYIARDNCRTGLATTITNDEVKLYDAFDCPICGCQIIMQERKRNYYELEIEDEEEIENE